MVDGPKRVKRSDPSPIYRPHSTHCMCSYMMGLSPSCKRRRVWARLLLQLVTVSSIHTTVWRWWWWQWWRGDGAANYKMPPPSNHPIIYAMMIAVICGWCVRAVRRRRNVWRTGIRRLAGDPYARAQGFLTFAREKNPKSVGIERLSTATNNPLIAN